MADIANGDIVIVLPGILGSTLTRGSRQTWGYRQIFRNLHRLASRLTEDLTLPADAFDDPAHGSDDGTRVGGALRTQGIIPGFWSIDGYDRLLAMLRRWFADAGERIHEFPYDWRQSNEHTAHRLRTFLEPLIELRRRSVPGARVVLVGHSMGGLVARFYAECLDHRRYVRRVITIGTPYQGAVKALEPVANGTIRLGPVALDLGELARSFPSVAELLPVYDCVGPSADRLRDLRQVNLPKVPQVVLDRSRAFHQRINDAVAAGGDDRPSYHVVVSHRQRTDLWALIDAVGEVRLRASAGFADGGDGTVPRCSASPPEWSDDAAARFVAGRHAALQQQRETLAQLRGILSSRPRYPQAAADEIAVDAPPCAVAGEDWPIEARSVEGSDRLVLTVTIDETSERQVRPVVRLPLRPQGGGCYRSVVSVPRPGVYRWTVSTEPTAATPIDPISDILLCVAD